MNLTFPEPHTILLGFPTQRELCESFVRVQEFYESPLLDIRGHYFTLEQFKTRYVPKHPDKATPGEFTYFADWHGFNVPGHIVEQFAGKFAHDMTTFEDMLVGLVRAQKGKAYVIGWHEDSGDRDNALAHELVHARWYLSPKWRENAEALVDQFTANNPVLAGTWAHLLMEWGYSPEVLKDETQAYFATTDRAWWVSEVGESLGMELWQAALPLRNLYALPRSMFE